MVRMYMQETKIVSLKYLNELNGPPSHITVIHTYSFLIMLNYILLLQTCNTRP